MSPLYFVTLPDACYISFGDTLLIHIHTLHFIYFLFHIFFAHSLFLYTHDTIARLFLFPTDAVRLLLLLVETLYVKQLRLNT